VALKNDGSVLAWGANGANQSTVPAVAQSGVIAIAAGAAHTVAIVAPPRLARLDRPNQFLSPLTIQGDLTVNGAIFASSLDASQLASGTVPDARLSANVALRSGDNNFSGNQFVAGSLNVNSPGYDTAAAILRARSGDEFPLAVQDFGGVNLLLVKTNGNVGIGTATPTNKLHVIGGITCTVLTQTSDRNAKENFAPVSPQEVLDKVAALPITTWNFKEMKDGRHMGPMAQDFYAAFGLGGGNTTITAVDPDGVALAAIQGLNQKLEEQRAENAELKQRLSQLENILNKLTTKKD
jgi:hypothetical protein